MKIKQHDFMCSCGDGKGKCEELMKEVKERLSSDTRSVDDSNLLTTVVYSLQWDFKDYVAEITGIFCDQWCAVSATGYKAGKEKYEEDVRTWIQCDVVEHGIAATWKFFADLQGVRS